MRNVEIDITKEDIEVTTPHNLRINGCAAFVAVKRKVPTIRYLIGYSAAFDEYHDKRSIRLEVPQEFVDFIRTADVYSHAVRNNMKNITLYPRPQPAKFVIGIPDDIPVLEPKES